MARRIAAPSRAGVPVYLIQDDERIFYPHSSLWLEVLLLGLLAEPQAIAVSPAQSAAAGSAQTGSVAATAQSQAPAAASPDTSCFTASLNCFTKHCRRNVPSMRVLDG